ncbi:MAG: hypothetical protein H6565_08370 [Lewinellaceae bacterium]|nr:hypothetical protein [Lewinellaceae bacterium]
MDNIRNSLKEMLASLIESRLKNTYMEEGFKGRDLDAIIEPLRKSGQFIREAEDMLVQLENEMLVTPTSRVFTNLRENNQELRELILEYKESLESKMGTIHTDLVSFKDNYSVDSIQRLSFEINNLELRIKNIENLGSEIEKMAQKKSSFSIWLFVGVNFLGLCLWLGLITLYKWEILEPASYIFGISILLFSNIIFALTGHRVTPEHIKNKIYAKHERHLRHLHQCNMDECEMVKEQVKKKQEKLDYFINNRRST